MTRPLLEIEHLRAYYQTHYFGVEREVRAVDDVSLTIAPNEIYGLAGESGSGKSTLIKVVAGAIRPPLNIVGGTVRLNFKDRSLDLGARPRPDLRTIRWKNLSYIMQGSMNVLNPLRRIRHTFVDFAARHIAQPRPVFEEIVRRHLERLHLDPMVLDAYPHELSGGMRQRVTIALATVCKPDLIIADEPTTALDVVVQKGVLAMIRSVQREIGASVLFVTHDLAVHANLCDRIGVMHRGRLVEQGPTGEVFRRPQHDYTRHLIDSLPRLGDAPTREVRP